MARGSGALVDFVSDDRARASSDGKSFSRLRWSTPFGKLRAQGSPRVPEHGEARWHETDGTDDAHIQMDLLDLVNDPTP